MMLLKISISNKFYSFEMSIHLKNPEKTNIMVSKNNTYSMKISVLHHWIKLHFKLYSNKKVILNWNNIWRFDCFYCIFFVCLGEQKRHLSKTLKNSSWLHFWMLLCICKVKRETKYFYLFFLLSGYRLRHRPADCRSSCQKHWVGRKSLQYWRNPEIHIVRPAVSAKGKMLYVFPIAIH